jgi:hypothetical protein
MLAELSGLTLLGAAIVATVFLLALGLAVGYRLGREAAGNHPGASPPSVIIPELLASFELVRTIAETLHDRSRAISDLARASPQRLPLDLQRAIDQLLDSAKVLGRQLERLGSVSKSPLATSSQLDRSPGNAANHSEKVQAAHPDDELAARLSGPSELGHSVPRQDQAAAHTESGLPAGASEPPITGPRLTGDEIHSLTTLAGHPSGREDDLLKRRYQYDCYQTAYIWHDNEPAGPISPGVTVRCHDIAVQGISFFWPDPPDFERLIISLGSPERPTFMAAEVVQSKAVYKHGEVGFIVGCRFAGRVPEFSEQNRVQLNARRNRTSSPLAPRELVVCT